MPMVKIQEVKMSYLNSPYTKCNGTDVSFWPFWSFLLSYEAFIKESCAYSEKFQGFNPQALVAEKIADELVFRHFQDEGVEFF